MSFIYGFTKEDNTVTFQCDDEKVFEDICDYIVRYIDAERYRREPKQVTIYQTEKTRRL